MERLAGALCAACIIISAACAARASETGFYVSAEGGVSLLPALELNNPTIGVVNEHFNTGYAYGGAIGYDDGYGQRIEFDSLYTRSELNKIVGIKARGHLIATSLMLNAQADLIPGSEVTPYVGIGGGFENLGGKIAGLKGNEWKPAYQVEGGVREDVTDNISMFAEYRFSQSEAVKLSTAGFNAHQHFADHAILAGMTYHVWP